MGGACDPQVGAAVGHLRDLGEDAARCGECVVDHPQRTAAADAGEVKSGGGLTFRDVAGAVGADEEERHAAFAPWRCSVDSRWHTVSKPTSNVRRQQVDVVAQRLGAARNGRTAAAVRRRSSSRDRCARAPGVGAKTRRRRRRARRSRRPGSGTPVAWRSGTRAGLLSVAGRRSAIACPDRRSAWDRRRGVVVTDRAR